MMRKIYLAKLIHDGDWNAINNDMNKRPLNPPPALRKLIGEGNVDGNNTQERILKALAFYGIEDNKVTLWGDGSPFREFLWSEDMADASVHVLLNVDFKDIIGVTLSRGNPVEEVVFWVDNNNANYVITKPFHHSQEVVETREDGVIFRIRVRYNYELERLILGFGNSIVVLAPSRLRRKISSLLKKAAANYTEEKLNI